MRFEAPQQLLLLLVVLPLLVLGYGALLRRRRERAQRWAEPALAPLVLPSPPAWRTHLPAALVLLSVVFAVLAFAEPVAAVSDRTTTGAIVVALDTSTSMRLTDVRPTRIAAARAAAREFIRDLPDSVDVGLVTFANRASTQLTPTSDRDALLATLADTPLTGGTAIGEAVHTSVVALLGAAERASREAGADAPALPLRAVLLSDGESTDGRPVAEAAAEAAASRVAVDTIAFGTPGGTRRPSADLATLRSLATTTGGTFQAAADARALARAYERLDGQVARTTERPVADWFVALAGLGALGAAGLAWPWFRRIPL